MFKFLNSASQSVTGAAIVIGAATLVSRLVGLVRDRVFVHLFGAGPVLDAYYAAFKIPDLIYNLLIVGALTAGFIPTFTKLFYQSENKQAAWRLANNIINIIGITLGAFALFGVFAAPALTKIIAPGFTGEAAGLVISFTRIMMLSPLLLGFSMIMGGILQSLKQFVLYSIAPIFYNVGIIIGAAGLTRGFLGINGLAWGVVLGAFIHLSIQVYGAYHSGYRWQWVLDLKNSDTRLVGKLMAPRTLGLALTQLNVVVVTMLASLLPVGSVAIFNLANNLQAVATGIIGVPFALAVFPVLSEMVAKKDGENFVKHLSATLRQILFLIVPASVLILLLRAQIVRVILGTGKFDWAATITTADTLAFFALGLFAAALIPLLARAFYALSNTKTPFIIGLIAELMSIIAALVLMRPLGVPGLALASAIGSIINCVVLFIYLRAETGFLEDQKIISSVYKIAISGVVMALVVQGLKYPLSNILDLNRFWGIFFHGVVSGVAGLLVYAVLARLLKLEEFMELQNSLKRRWLRFWNVPAGIDEAERL